MDSWKENKENNIRCKKSKYKGYNYNNNYNNHLFYRNKKHFKDYKTYKFNYNRQSNSNNYNINGNLKNNYIEKEIELISKGETEGDSEKKIAEVVEDNIPECSLDFNSKNNIDFNTKEINSLDLLNLDLMKSQSEDLSHKNLFDFHDIGIKLFPGAFHFNKLKSYEKNNINLISNENNKLVEENKKISELNFDSFKNKNDIECNNYLCKANNGNIKNEQKNGLALAFDYYSSFLEDKIIIK